MQIQQYLRIIKEGWWVIVATLLVSAGAGLAYSYTQTPIYQATATFVVNPSVRIAETFDLLYSINTLAGRTSLATTYAKVLESRVITEPALASLGLAPETLEEYEIRSVVLPDSNILELQIQGPSPALAADLANSIGDAGLEYVSTLQEAYELYRLDLAAVDPEPVSPNHIMDLFLSISVGTIAGLAFILLPKILLQLMGEEPGPVAARLPVAASKQSEPDGREAKKVVSQSLPDLNRTQ